MSKIKVEQIAFSHLQFQWCQPKHLMKAKHSKMCNTFKTYPLYHSHYRANWNRDMLVDCSSWKIYICRHFSYLLESKKVLKELVFSWFKNIWLTTEVDEYDNTFGHRSCSHDFDCNQYVLIRFDMFHLTFEVV